MIAPALLLLLASPAGAYKLLGYAWAPDDFCLEWWMTDYVEDSLENAATYGYASAWEAQVAVNQKGFDNWADGAPCAEICDTFMGVDAGNEGKTNDGINKIYWDDPTGFMGEGVLAVAAYSVTAEYLREQDGQYLYRFGDVDVTFNDQIDWTLTEEIEGGQPCSGGMAALEPVATHELGHLWGVGHSCEEGEPCTDETLRYATMYWANDSCDIERNTINPDDVAAINALYGPYATFTTDSQRFGGVPLTVDFRVLAAEDTNITGVEWRFGDGATSADLAPSHTYEDQGQYSVVLRIDGNNESCGDWSFEYRERAYVVACEAPAPGLAPGGEPYPGLFTFDHLEGLQYQMVNRADTSVYGCLDTVVWQVYGSGGDMVQEISAWSPIIELPSEGTWRVVLNVGGPGGISAADLTIDTADHAEGCSAVPTGAGLAGLLVGLGLALARRRRR